MKKNKRIYDKGKTDPPTSENRPVPRPPIVSIGESKRRVLESLSKTGSAHRIRKDLSKAKSTIVQHLQELQGLGFTDKVNHIWYVTDKGNAYLKGVGFSRGVREKGVGITSEWLLRDRAHNIKIKFPVLEQPKDMGWLRGWKVNDKMKNNIFYRERFGEILTTFTGKSLIIQLPILTFLLS